VNRTAQLFAQVLLSAEFKAQSIDPGFWTLLLAIKIDRMYSVCSQAPMNASMTRVECKGEMVLHIHPNFCAKGL
jgi:hypothetical protein